MNRMQSFPESKHIKSGVIDSGPLPYVVNLEQAALQNKTFRSAIWTGTHLQITLMSIPVGGDIGLEIHPYLDQYLQIEQGFGVVSMGKSRDNLNYTRSVGKGYAVMIPAGTWHNLRNAGNRPVKLYSVYAPPQHPRGTLHITKADALAAETNQKE